MPNNLAPTSFELPAGLDASVSPSNGSSATAATGKALVVGSLNTAGDQSYQNLVKSLEETTPGGVERQLWDRVVAGATDFVSGAYSAVHILLSAPDLEGFSLPDLLGPIADALSPGGNLEISGVDNATAGKALKTAGFLDVVEKEGKLTARKNSDNSASANNGSVPLKLRRPATNKSAKASIWALQPSSETTLIDDSTLLTAEDLSRPTLITKPDCDVKKTRKACKNCTCGLRELELEEDDDLPEALKGAVEDNEAKMEAKAVKGGKGKKMVKSGAVTSSCGSCYLGDAFRCSGCPYLGLPAFEPGQKVMLTAEMGDDI